MLPKLTDSTVNVNKSSVYNGGDSNRDTSIYHPDRSAILEQENPIRKSTAKILDASMLQQSYV